MGSGSLTYHFLYVIAFMRDISSLVLESTGLIWMTSAAPSDGISALILVDMEQKVANFNVPGMGLLSQLPLDALQAVGTHNYYNAAIAALSVIGLDVGIDIAAISSTIDKLKAPPHRMQIVREDRHGVTWVDDSKATNVEATYAGLMGLREKKSVVLLGGLSKILDAQGSNGFEQLIEPLKYHRGVVTFGSSGALIKHTLSSHGLSIPCLGAKDLKDAVSLAKNMAKPAKKEIDEMRIEWAEFVSSIDD